uniref:uncharacterized protein LOC110598459 n=1 Tax=Ictidomys tridecemlineatus TaxID=43179 RepID=UPI001A9F7012|nr:uncharacterized protein LOC110598459 [Ictidomys tridecemlineatus]
MWPEHQRACRPPLGWGMPAPRVSFQVVFIVSEKDKSCFCPLAMASVGPVTLGDQNLFKSLPLILWGKGRHPEWTCLVLFWWFSGRLALPGGCSYPHQLCAGSPCPQVLTNTGYFCLGFAPSSRWRASVPFLSPVGTQPLPALGHHTPHHTSAGREHHKDREHWLSQLSCYCDQRCHKNRRRGKVHLGLSGHRRLTPSLWAQMGRSIMVGGPRGREQLWTWLPGSRESSTHQVQNESQRHVPSEPPPPAIPQLPTVTTQRIRSQLSHPLPPPLIPLVLCHCELLGDTLGLAHSQHWSADCECWCMGILRMEEDYRMGPWVQSPAPHKKEKRNMLSSLDWITGVMA